MQDGVQGKLVEPRDSAGLAHALRELLLSPQEQKNYGEHGRITAQAFSWERISARIIRFYEDVRQGSAADMAGWAPPLDTPAPWFGAQSDDLVEPVSLSEGVGL